MCYISAQNGGLLQKLKILWFKKQLFVKTDPIVQGFFSQCLLTCHKKCLETLLINCGHQKLPARASLFGIDFSDVPRDFPEEVPFIVMKCTSEIETRALGVQVTRSSMHTFQVLFLFQGKSRNKIFIPIPNTKTELIKSPMHALYQPTSVEACNSSKMRMASCLTTGTNISDYTFVCIQIRILHIL